MHIIKTEIDDVFIIEPKVFEDDRGYFFESYNQMQLEKAGVAVNILQDNQSLSKHGVIRELHCQTGEHAQTKLVRAIQGNILDVVVDIRKNSKTFGKHVAIELSDKNQRQLFVPRGFLHGFSVLSHTALISYKCDNYYNKDSESGVRFDDLELSIDWKIEKDNMSISEKDLQLGRFCDVAHYGV